MLSLDRKYRNVKAWLYVHRGDFGKDDSGFYAEQGSSAPQMTAAKVTDVIARLLGRAIETSKVRMCRYLDTSTTTQVAPILVQHWRPSRSSWTKSVWSPTCRMIVGKTIWKQMSTCDLGGKSSGLGMPTRASKAKPILIGIRGWLEEHKTPPFMWKKLMKLVDLGEPTSSLDHVFLGRTQRECKSDESII